MSIAIAAALCAFLGGGRAAQAINVTTYHNDTLRTGWNQHETKLTPTTVAGAAFKQLANVTLDEQVDAQPLFMAAQTIPGKGQHDTVYVVTEKNTVYGIDANSGEILLQRNLGPPVPLSELPGGCPNSSRSVGVNSTPVIDAATKTLYVLTYNFGTGKAAYWMHALDLSTLEDKVPRALVRSASTLADKERYAFNAAVNRQRAALLLQDNTVYAAFTSFCDNSPSLTRGWVLGWNADTLDIPDRRITNRLPTSPQSYFLSTIWMSGYGIAGANHSLFFVTGNSDPKNTAFYPENLAESVVKLGSDLTTVESYFTPGTAATGRAVLDAGDHDFGAGGVMALPWQPGAYPRLAVAAGKLGILYVMNRDSLGGYTSGADKVLGQVNIGECFCGESYYKGTDGVGRVVASGGQKVGVWKVTTSPTAAPKLVRESISISLNGGQDSGFFTAISSNGAQAKSQIVWALSRPANKDPGAIKLFAFDPSTVSASGVSKLLFSGPAGSWASGSGNANLVPVVANGHVFVASYKQLTIFGLGTGSAQAADKKAPTTEQSLDDNPEASLPGHAVYGKLQRVDGATLTLETRTGSMLTVDSSPAAKAEANALPIVGRAMLVRGEYDKRGVLHAISVQRVKNSPALWGNDR